MRAKKSLGQNFLTNTHYLNLIASECINKTDKILEIGCGTGNLTTAILQNFTGNLCGIELDDRAPIYLDQIKLNYSNFQYKLADALDLDYTEYIDHTIVGNLPYNIGSRIVLDCIRLGVNRMVFLLQKEVVARLSAKVGTNDYGSMSVLAQAYYFVQPKWTIAPSCFSPAPSVYSQVVVLEKKSCNVNFKLLSTLLSSAFSCRRKMIGNTLLKQYPELTHIFNSTLRPQNIDVQEYLNSISLIIR